MLERLVGTGALLAVFAAVAAGVSASSSALPRATTDRPDDVLGPQVHFVYAVPADGGDRHLDDSGTIEGSVELFQRWLRGETGGRGLRIDRYQGSLDVSFARLRTTDAELAARGAYVRDGIEHELQGMGFTKPGKIYAVYYDGTSTYACGGAFWPPRLRGNVVAMYLRGLPTAPVPCASKQLVTAGPPGYWEYAMLHDILHGLGLVAECAPNQHREGHVTSPTNDLMWAGEVGHWGLPPKLDVGRDDYYGHGRADCPDLARSPYLKPLGPEVATYSTTAKARSGRVFRATLKLDERLFRVDCAARAGRTKLRASRVVRGALGECRWRLPRNKRGKLLRGSITAIADSGLVTKTFSLRIT